MKAVVFSFTVSRTFITSQYLMCNEITQYYNIDTKPEDINEKNSDIYSLSNLIRHSILL